MPDDNATPTPTESATPAPTPPATIPYLVDGRKERGLGLRREKGKLVLRLDVSGLHAYLDAIGVEREASYKRFANFPQSRAEIFDTNENALAPRALCSFDYAKDPVTGTVKPGILEFDVMRSYSSAPPNTATMEEIAKSVAPAVTAVLSHYQPVEISLSVLGKKG